MHSIGRTGDLPPLLLYGGHPLSINLADRIFCNEQKLSMVYVNKVPKLSNITTVVSLIVAVVV